MRRGGVDRSFLGLALGFFSSTTTSWHTFLLVSLYIGRDRSYGGVGIMLSCNGFIFEANSPSFQAIVEALEVQAPKAELGRTSQDWSVR